MDREVVAMDEAVAGEIQVSRQDVMAKLGPKLAEAKNRREKTFATAKILFFDFGVFPSAKIVRSFTEQGSSNDIQADLRMFWTETQQVLRARLNAPSLPSDLVDVFGQALERVWLLAVNKAAESFDEARRKAEATVAAAEHAARDAVEMVDVIRGQFDALGLELRNERERRELAEVQIRVSEVQLSQMEEKVRELQNELERERGALLDAQVRAADDLEAGRKERDRLIDSHQKEIEAADGARVFALGQIEAVRRDLDKAKVAADDERRIRMEESGHYRQRVFAVEAELQVALKHIKELELETVGQLQEVNRLNLELEKQRSTEIPILAERKKMKRRASIGMGKRWK